AYARSSDCGNDRDDDIAKRSRYHVLRPAISRSADRAIRSSSLLRRLPPRQPMRIRDLIAAVVALVLVFVAASLGTTLQAFRRRRQRNRDSERALGRTIIAEIPAAEDLVLFSEDGPRFYYGERSIDKDLIVAVRVLINGAPIASYVSPRHPEAPARQATQFEDRPASARGSDDELRRGRADGVERGRWDVPLEPELA